VHAEPAAAAGPAVLDRALLAVELPGLVARVSLQHNHLPAEPAPLATARAAIRYRGARRARSGRRRELAGLLGKPAVLQPADTARVAIHARGARRARRGQTSPPSLPVAAAELRPRRLVASSPRRLPPLRRHCRRTAAAGRRRRGRPTRPSAAAAAAAGRRRGIPTVRPQHPLTTARPSTQALLQPRQRKMER